MKQAATRPKPSNKMFERASNSTRSGQNGTTQSNHKADSYWPNGPDWNSICNTGAAGIPSLDEILDQSTVAGLKHLVFGYIGKGHREQIDQYKQHAEAANKFGEKCKASGIKLCYHNHAFEYEKLTDDSGADGKCGYDILIDELDKELW